MTEKGQDNFESGILWELYKDLERQFESFLEYVPFWEDNEKTYSFKLLNLILNIGGHVDSAFKEMVKYPDFSSNTDCQKIVKIMKQSEENIKRGKAPITAPISLSLKALDTLCGISEEKLIHKRLPEREFIVPFQPINKKTRAPNWWEIYNGVKHNLSDNLKEASLRNPVDALAGAFLLNVRHIPALIRLYRFGLIKMQWNGESAGKSVCDEWEEQDFLDCINNKSNLQQGPFFVETSIFLYLYGKGTAQP